MGSRTVAATSRSFVETASHLGHSLRGISVHQLCSVFVEVVLEDDFPANASIQDIETQVIIPGSANSQCPRDSEMGAAYVDCLHGQENTGLASHMLCYAVSQRLCDITDTVRAIFDSQDRNSKKTYLWMSSFCINLHRSRELTGSMSTKEFEASVMDRIRSIGHLIVIVAPWSEPVCLKRTWCMYEMYIAISSELEVEIALPPSESQEFYKMIEKPLGLTRLYEIMTDIKIEQTECGMPGDKERILNLVHQPGYDEVNRTVSGHLKRFISEAAVEFNSRHPRLKYSRSCALALTGQRAHLERNISRLPSQDRELEAEDSRIFDMVKLLVISDPGQDMDDEMAFLLLSELYFEKVVEPLGIIANLRPSENRAILARGTLDMIGLDHVPIGIGTDGGSEKHKDTFSEYITEYNTGYDYLAPAWEDYRERGVDASDSRIRDGQKLMVDVLTEAADSSVTLLLISSVKDAAKLLREHEALFKAKVRCVTIMGGIEAPETENPIRLLPDKTAHNNMFDLEASMFFYDRVQALGIQLVVLSRFAAYACSVQRHVYDLMIRCPLPNPVVCRLHAAQRDSIDRLWKNVNDGGILPPRCNREWFCKTFCGGKGMDRAGGDSMWDLVGTFNMYDPMALLACIPSKRELFFNCEKFDIIADDGITVTSHLAIGTSSESHGIRRDNELRDFMFSTWLTAASRQVVHRGAALNAEVRAEALARFCDSRWVVPSKRGEAELKNMASKVLSLLQKEWPGLKNSSFLDTWRVRDKLMSEAGPSMRLVSYETIEELGRIPHSDEGRTISLEEAANIANAKGKRFFIEMFSHRWNSRYAPDDRYGSKAHALVEWGKYRWASGLGTFYWIDYSCVNQADIAAGIVMLPLYVASCNNILCFQSADYEARSWCRLERLMFAAFCAPTHDVIGGNFQWSGDPQMPPDHEGKVMLTDPLAGVLTYPEDIQSIRDLMDIAASNWSSCWKDGLKEAVRRQGLEGLDNMELGTSTVRLRSFLKKEDNVVAL